MKTNGKRIFLGILLTLIVFLASTFAGKSFSLNNEFIPDTFITNIVMLTLSICLIWGFKKYVSYKTHCQSLKRY